MNFHTAPSINPRSPRIGPTANPCGRLADRGSRPRSSDRRRDRGGRSYGTEERRGPDGSLGGTRVEQGSATCGLGGHSSISSRSRSISSSSAARPGFLARGAVGGVERPRARRVRGGASLLASASSAALDLAAASAAARPRRLGRPWRPCPCPLPVGRGLAGHHERELDAGGVLALVASETGGLRRRIEIQVGLLLELGQVALHPLVEPGALLALTDLVLDVLEGGDGRLAALDHLGRCECRRGPGWARSSSPGASTQTAFSSARVEVARPRPIRAR